MILIFGTSRVEYLIVQKAIFSFLALSAIAGSGVAATTAPGAKHRVPKRSSAVVAPARKLPTSTAAHSGTQRNTASKKAFASRRRSYQQAPTQDRYREIQTALMNKGYFHGQLNGEWGSDSTDALKRFQAEQNLQPDGRLNSLSLIAMGLGPKRMTAVQSFTQAEPVEAPRVEIPK